MKKKICIIVFIIFICCFVVSCKKDADKITDTIIGVDYGDWEKINSAVASSDNQMMYSLKGSNIDQKFDISISAELVEVVTIKLGYELELNESEFSGTSVCIDKGHTVDFYCRIVYEVHKIEINGNSNTVYIPYCPQYGWMIYDENFNLIKNTTDESFEYTEMENSGTDMDETIERYILDCCEGEISLEVLRELTDDELYYIRNGIYAYCGRKFDNKQLEEYYSRFSWYDPQINSMDFKWKYLNKNQQDTIENIREVEKERQNDKET